MAQQGEPDEQDLGGIPGWYREIFPAGPCDGFYAKLGAHSASFVDRGTHQLVVTFDNLSDAGNPRYDREPWAGKFCADNGWSHLGVYAQPPSWFRDARLISYLEGLRDDGFFKRFERVAFCGTSMGGFGAVTFCDLSPGCTVMAFSPQTTLAADLVPWEKRFAKGRAMDWSLPYSDAAEHTAQAGKVFVVYDPFLKEDATHALRLKGDNIVFLRGFGLGHKSAFMLHRMDRLKLTMAQAITGDLTPARFYAQIRNRKDIYLYRTNIESYLETMGRPALIDIFRNAFKQRRRAQKRATRMEATT